MGRKNLIHPTLCSCKICKRKKNKWKKEEKKVIRAFTIFFFIILVLGIAL
jgi:hypothetical protein